MDYYINNEKMLVEHQRNVRKNIAEQYMRARKMKHLTQEELANKLNITRPNISRFESGEYNPTIDMLVKMAECLDMNLNIELGIREKGE